MPRLVAGPPSHAAPSAYKLAPSEAFIPESVTATFDGSGAAGAFLPTLSIYAQSGELLARSPATEIAAGSSAEVTFAPLLRAASAAAGGGDFTRIFHDELSAEGYFNFTSIPQTFSHLFCVIMGRINDPDGTALLQFNGDTNGANYASMFFEAQQAFIIAGDIVGNGVALEAFPGSFATAGQIGTHFFMIPAYKGTMFNKQVIVSGGYPGGSPLEYEATLGEWISTAAITSLLISSYAPGGPGVNDFVAGSTLDVYGIT